MITFTGGSALFMGDQRNDAGFSNTIVGRLSALYANPKFSSILSNYGDNTLFTTKYGQVTKDGVTTDDLNGYDLSGVVGFSDRDGVANPISGPGIVYRDSDTGVINYSKLLLLSPDVITGGIDASAFSGSPHMSFTRILFHEMMHAAFQWNYVGPNHISFEEELAVFAENVIYRQIAPSMNLNDVFIRYGHTKAAWDGRGVSGVNSFAEYLSSSNGTVDVDITNSNDKVAIFTASAGPYNLTKTYHNSGYVVAYYAYDHYINLTESNSYGSYIDLTPYGYFADARVSTLVGDMMHGDVDGALKKASDALHFLNSESATAPSLNISRITGVGADAFGESGWKDGKEGVFFGYVGPASSGSSDLSTPTLLEQDDRTASASTLIVGSGGQTGNVIWAGSGNDLVIAGGALSNTLYGNDGNDILVGTTGIDKLYGGAGNDLLIGGDGANVLDGGDDTDTAYYGDRPSGITVYDGQGRVGHDGVFDNIKDIEQFIGTAGRDVFIADGQGHTFFGNGGTDQFLAADGPDTFRGVNGKIDGTISFAALTTDNNHIGINGTSLGHVYDQAATIVGSNYRDTIDVGSSVVRAGGGNDTIVVYNRDVFGEAGNDTFLGIGMGGMTIDGGDDIDTIDVRMQFSPTTTIYINWRDAGHSIQIGAAGSITPSTKLVSVEEYIFSPTGPALAIHLSESKTNTFTGTFGANDRIWGGDKDDLIYAGGSYSSTNGHHNEINGGGGIDHIYGAQGVSVNDIGDWLSGEDGDDIIYGSNGKDTLWGGKGTDELHGGLGDDHFYEGLGTNYIWGDDGNDYTHFDSTRFSDLTFGTNGDWRYVEDKAQTFRNYFKSVEYIVTSSGIYSAGSLPASRAAGGEAAAQHHSADGFDFSGFDMSGLPDGEDVPDEITDEGNPAYVPVSIQDVWTPSSVADLWQGDAVAFKPEVAASADMFAQAIASNGYAGAGDMSLLYQQPDMIGMFPSAFQTPIHHDMLFM